MKAVLVTILSLVMYCKGQQSETSFRLPICSLSEFTIKDLYSPMTIGYQLIKRGFCIVYENGPLDDLIVEKTESVEQPEVQFVSDTWTKTIASLSPTITIPVPPNQYKPYDPVILPGTTKRVTLPIVLPNGLCLNGMMPVRYLENKVVSCAYLTIDWHVNNIALLALYTTCTCYIVSDNSHYNVGNACNENDGPIKRVEIVFTINATKVTSAIMLYQDLSVTGNTYYGVTYDIKFQTSYFPRSGNPGYLQSYPLISGIEGTINNVAIIAQYAPQLIFSGVNADGACVIPANIEAIKAMTNHYYDANVDNRLTFERSILYGCTHLSSMGGGSIDLRLLFNGILHSTLTRMSRFGNGQPNYLADWLTISNNIPQTPITYNCANNRCDMPLITLNFLYSDVGATNNTQSTLLAVEYKTQPFTSYQNQIPPAAGGTPTYHLRIYIKANFLKYPLDKIKWYAPGPGFILLPRNMMYPFRIGSTTFAERPIIT